MKRTWKVFWITCGIVGCIGLVCLIAGTAMGAKYEMFYNSFPYGIGLAHIGEAEQVQFGTVDPAIEETFQDIDSIELDISCLSVQILESEDSSGQIRMEATDMDPRLRFQYAVEGSRLQIDTNDMKSLWGIRNIVNRGRVCLYVPKEKLEEVSLDLGVGDVYVENLDVKDFSVNAGVGEVTIDNFTADTIDFECGTGEMWVSGKPKESAAINCGVGSIDFTIDGTEKDYDYYVECGIGEVAVGEYRFDGLGSEKQIDNGSGKSVEIECGVGSVKVSFAE